MKHTNQTLLTLRRSGFVVMTGVLLLAGCTEELAPVPPKPVKSIVLTEPEALSESTFPGRVLAGQEANLSFRVSGPLVELPVKVGDNVSVGAVIARIDPNDFEVLLRNAKGAQLAAQAAFKRANADYKRLIKTQAEDAGATSQRAVDRALAARDAARATVSSADATVQTAADRINYTALQAPFDGEVVETYVENFETVIAKQVIARMMDTSQIEMILSVPENLIGYTAYVTNVVVSFDALPGVEVAGHIKEVGHEASQATHTYPVTISMEQPADGKILPGMAGQARVSAKLPETADNGIHVPAAALFTGVDSTKSYVWVIVGDTIAKREVQTDTLTANGMLVNSGLSAGERIVSAGVNFLTDGQKIRLLKSEETK